MHDHNGRLSILYAKCKHGRCGSCGDCNWEEDQQRYTKHNAAIEAAQDLRRREKMDELEARAKELEDKLAKMAPTCIQVAREGGAITRPVPVLELPAAVLAAI